MSILLVDSADLTVEIVSAETSAPRRVRTLQRRKIRGALVRASDHRLIVDVDATEEASERWEISRTDVEELSRLVRTTDSGADGALFGAIGGAVLFGAYAASVGDIRAELFVPIGAGLGSFLGLIIDGLGDAERAELVYRRSLEEAASPPRLLGPTGALLEAACPGPTAGFRHHVCRAVVDTILEGYASTASER